MNTIPKGILILGFGGHARSVADVAVKCGVSQLLFIDAAAQVNEKFLEFDVLKELPKVLPNGWAVFPGAGNNHSRKLQLELAKQRGWEVATIIAPSATIGVGSVIEKGTFIANQAHIGPMASIGFGCIINTGAIVDHESVIGDYSHISVNSTVAGRVRIGSSTFIGAGAIVIDSLSICSDVTLGAGSCTVGNILVSGVYVGIPTRKIK